MASGNAPPPPQPPGGSMLMMLGVMVMMTLLIMNPDIRNSLGDVADPILDPILPQEAYFVLTVLILGSFSMTMNTVLRNFFTDPLAQAHIGHRQGQVRRMMNDARLSRDPILQEKATTLQQQMMPEQLKVQMGAMKPMMFTMVFIIGIFAWLTTAVESFRVDYVSLPWASEWNLLEDKFLFFPAWICAYICMSAPLGRVIDRHIKLFRYRKHPLVMSGETLKEPLLHLVATSTEGKGGDARRRQQRSQRNTNSNRRKSKSNKKDSDIWEQNDRAESQSVSAIGSNECPECGLTMVTRMGPRTKRCDVCRHEWV
ncbi:MAG: EMC3/TMCO1 family protein [Candidatus Poseidoniaceae archaeon]|nr:EMC3/TMCO1 family protein [Candidatus Poseidoniaceae archaeon]